MAPSVPSTPFPLGSRGTSHEGEASPAELLSFLETLIAENLSDDNTECIPASAKESWATIVEGLSDHFLATFPKQRSVLWNMLHEKIRLCSTGLTVIERAAMRVEGLFSDTDSRSFDTVQRMFDLLLALQAWSCGPIPQCTKIDTPGVLRNKLIKSLEAVLVSFTSTIAESTVLSSVLNGCLRLISGMWTSLSHNSRCLHHH